METEHGMGHPLGMAETPRSNFGLVSEAHGLDGLSAAAFHTSFA
jgi:hypothetical protein